MMDHAKLSASSSHKWIHCPGSVPLEVGEPESTSTYAEEGRLAHEIGELKLRKAFIEPMGARAFNAKLKKLQEHPQYNPEMLTTTDVYLNYISEIAHACTSRPYVAVEKRLDFSAWVPEGFGTGDCVMLFGDSMWVNDYKHGKGVPVSAENNSQMLLYALGAYAAYSLMFPIKTIHLAIIQPRLSDEPSTWTLSVEDLLAWGEWVKPIAATAASGDGECNSGEWCRFCRAKAKCRVRADNHTALEAFGGRKPPLLTNEEVGAVLAQAINISTWVADLEEYALTECLSGREVPGWKAVEGRSNRSFTDQEAAFKALRESGTPNEMLYERKPLTLTGVEELIGKPKFKTLLNQYVVKPPGKPTLAPATDKREPIKTQSAREIFATVEESKGDQQ